MITSAARKTTSQKVTSLKIPFNKPSLAGKELEYIQEALKKGHLAGDGYFTDRCSRFLEKFIGIEKALLTPSCTHALEMAYLLLEVGPGDEVVLPSFTFPSTANAFVLRGARPRFVDIRPDTLNIDEKQIERAITPAVKVISPVHYAGVPCQMDTIMDSAKKHGLRVVEDAAQALGATFKGRPAGSFGDLNAVSFHETKNVSCGEGGVLLVKERKFIDRAEIVRQKGTNRAQFYRGMVDKYSWVDVGSSNVPSELQAAFLLGQLEALNRIWRKRKTLYERYYEALLPLQQKGRIKLPKIPKDCVSTYHLFHIILENKRERDALMEALARVGIYAVFHYFPLHLSQMGRKLGYQKGDFPVSEAISDQLLRLPMYNSMSDIEQNHVINELMALLDH